MQGKFKRPVAVDHLMWGQEFFFNEVIQRMRAVEDFDRLACNWFSDTHNNGTMENVWHTTIAIVQLCHHPDTGRLALGDKCDMLAGAGAAPTKCILGLLDCRTTLHSFMACLRAWCSKQRPPSPRPERTYR